MTSSFTYRAVHTISGQLTKGYIVAQDERELATVLKRMNLDLISSKPSLARNHTWQLFSHQYAPSTHNLAHLCKHIELLLKAGVDIRTTLHLVGQGLYHHHIRSIIDTIHIDLENGKSITQAFSKHVSLFSPVFLALLKAGESSGDLSGTFGALAEYLEWNDKIKKQATKAIRYPLFLLSVTFAVILFMMSYVMPSLTEFLASLNMDLPMGTRLLLSLSSFFSFVWWSLPAILVILTLIIFILKNQSHITLLYFDRLTLSVPIIGRIVNYFALARMMRGFCLLLIKGVPIMDVFESVIGTLNNSYLSASLKEASVKIEHGTPLSTAMVPLLPPMAVHMLMIGERSGTIPHAMKSASSLLETEAKESLSRTIDILEPSLTISVGAIMVWIVLAVLGPVYGALTPLTQGI